ncbi:hypothetical protein WJX81_001973 [Elliptochloris bilobata]|uniref:RNA helicase n=1 Tax=Elliptochloris bilobata TaxID=381761 RepID=A0AAW1RVY0_9CHLO
MGAGGNKRAREALDAAAAQSLRASLQAAREALPIWAARAQLVEEVRCCTALVLVGETGSGKTTQLPQFLLAAGLAQGGMIGVTQPRRVAATSVARRVAQEMGVALGAEVGYTIRFDDVSSGATRIKYLTDGMLLREALADPLLRRYKVIVLDEAHERTMQTDILFGLIKGVQARRKGDLRLVVMSATLDAAKFVTYFAGSKAAYLQGRQFPVQVLYTAAPEESYLDAALATVMQVHAEEAPGDVLVFLTGQDEIESLARLINARAAVASKEAGGIALQVVPIYAALPPEQQARVFEPAPDGARKVVLATNIAETSITIPGVRYVVDPGLIKARSYNARLGSDSLQVVPTSQAQARQRSGRAGREAPGKAFRLYTEAAFQALPPTTEPEIRRSPLAGMALQLLALGVTDLPAFDFMDKPPMGALMRALEQLLALGALDADGRLTQPLGRRMARLPVDPAFAKVLLAGAETCCAEEALTVVAMVSTDPVFTNPGQQRDAAAAARRRFVSPLGDHLTLLNVFQAYLLVGKAGRGRWCAEHHVSARALRKAADIRAQLAGHLTALELQAGASGAPGAPGDATDRLRRALVAGLFSHAAVALPDGTFKVLASGQAVALHPSSVLCGKRPACIVFDELLRTTRDYARQVTAIDAAWLPELAPIFFARHAQGG